MLTVAGVNTKCLQYTMFECTVTKLSSAASFKSIDGLDCSAGCFTFRAGTLMSSSGTEVNPFLVLTEAGVCHL